MLQAAVLPAWIHDTVRSVERAFDGIEPGAKPGEASVIFLARELHRGVRKLRRTARRTIDRGLEAQTLIDQYSPVAESLAGVATHLHDFIARIGTESRNAVNRHLRARLQKVEVEAQETRAFLEMFLRKARAPRAAIDSESLSRGRDDAAAKRKEDAELIAQRLWTGGEI